MEKSQITFLEASAGSGKTHSISMQYIKLLFDEIKMEGYSSYRTILAVTFAKKAAIEMKERILSILKKIEFGKFDNDEEKSYLLSNFGADLEQLKIHSRNFIDNILDDYSSFLVKTIDSFFNDIVVSYSHKLDLRPNFEIIDNADDYILKSIDFLLEDSSINKKILEAFESFIDRVLYLENKITWDPKGKIFSILKSLYSIQKTYGGEFDLLDLPTEKILNKKEKIISLLQELSSEKSLSSLDSRFVNSIYKILNLSKNFSLKDLGAYFERDELPVKKGAFVNESCKKKWRQIRALLKEVFKDEAFSKYSPYIKIFKMIDKKLKELSLKENVFFISDFNDAVNELLEKKSVPYEEMILKLSANIRHYLIDEFQDCNDFQWQNFSPMVDEALSSGGSLFIVGDRKQSIYRFRGSNPLLLRDIKNNFIKFKSEELYLEQNRRSAPEIVKFNIETFGNKNLSSFLNNIDEDFFVQEILDVFKNVYQKSFNESYKGFVSIEHVGDLLSNENDEEIEIIKKKTIEKVKLLKTKYNYSDICILCRENGQVKDVSSWLIEENIPVSSQITLSVFENPLIKELLSLLSFFSSLVDDLSFASFIRGEIFSSATKKEKAEIENFLFQYRLNGDKKSKALYLTFKEKYGNIWDEYFSDLSRTVGFVPVYEFIIRILSRFSVLENFPSQSAYISKLLDFVLVYAYNTTNISDFMEIVEGNKDNAYVNQVHNDAVNVMTIHKAKGLQFHSCIIPFLTFDVKISKLNNSGNYLLDKQNDHIKIVDATKKYANFVYEIKKLYEIEYTKALCDELDVLYVALTRPIFNLIAFIPDKVGNKKNIAKDLIPAQQIGTFLAQTKSLKKSDLFDKIELNFEKISDPTQYIRGDDFTEMSAVNRDKMVFGEITHFILSKINDYKSGLTDEIIELAKNQFPFYDISIPLKLAKNIIKNKNTKKFFEEGLNVFTEKEIVTINGRVIRLDRLIIKDDEVWIVDFKSSEEDSFDHIEQIKNYKLAVSLIFPQKKVRGYLVYFDSQKVEEV